MIRVEDYNPIWAEHFEQLRKEIWPKVQNHARAIEHVGSTSVVGLAAKPIIDVDIVVGSQEDLRASTQALVELGYRHLGTLGIEGRDAFRAPPSRSFAHNLYVCRDGCAALRNHLALREHLKTSVKARNEYSELKKKLALQFADSIEEYVQGKTKFILNILANYDLSRDELSKIEKANLAPNAGNDARYEHEQQLKIETENLTLRLPEQADAAAIVRYFKENSEHFAPTDPKKPDDFYTESLWQKNIDRFHNDFKSGLGVRFHVHTKQNELIATIGLSQILRGPFQACYLGYGIGKKFEGKGYMFEALRATINYAFHDLNLHRIMANHLPENQRSAQVLQRLGFVKEGIAKNYLYIHGEWRDHVLNSLTNQDWTEK